MAQPTPYDRITNFQNDQALAPTDPYPGEDFDAECNAIKITTDEIIQNLSLIQRDDGVLANDSVGLDQLNDEVILGFGAPEQWETAHNYIEGNTVFQDNAFWYCETSHVSGDFNTDQAEGYWSLIADFTLASSVGAAMFIGDAPPPIPTAGQQWFESDTGNTFTWYDDGVSAQWVHTNGAAGDDDDSDLPLTGGELSGPLTLASDPTVALHAATKQYVDNTSVSLNGDTMTGDLIVSAEVKPTTVRFNGDSATHIVSQRTNPAIYGTIGSTASVGFMVNAVGQVLTLGTNGTPCLTLATNSSFTIASPPTGVVALTVNGSLTAAYGILSRAKALETGGIIGFSVNDTAYGISGAYFSGYFSFYGSAGAFISSGTWATSDGRLKTVTGELNSSAALAAVNALLVKEYTPSSPAARSTLYGEAAPRTETLYGWVAQDVEPILPIAVRDVGIPQHDLTMRAALKHSTVPQQDSAEAKALSDEVITVKAINDRYMLTTLWSAVQQLSTQIEALHTRIKTLEEKAP